jgi:hypothetical protein
MSDKKTKKALAKYVNTATDLAESVKRNIVHDGIIDNETVLKLNAFIIASNDIEDLNKQLSEDSRGDNDSLN